MKRSYSRLVVLRPNVASTRTLAARAMHARTACRTAPDVQQRRQHRRKQFTVGSRQLRRVVGSSSPGGAL
eukprot:13683657-Alexandrium_andersonii.AAC.1